MLLVGVAAHAWPHVQWPLACASTLSCNNAHGAAVAHALAGTLPALKSRGNGRGDAAATKLVPALMHLTKLQMMSLENASLFKGQWVRMQPLLVRLRWLSAALHGLGAAALDVLLQVLMRLTSLTVAGTSVRKV